MDFLPEIRERFYVSMGLYVPNIDHTPILRYREYFENLGARKTL